MAIIRSDSQQTMASFSLTRGDGERTQAVSASCHIRPGKGMSINVDVLDGATITDEVREELCAAVADYIAEETAKADALGVPVLPAQA